MTFNPDNPDETYEQFGHSHGARTCAWSGHCRCTHTNCWDGFLDQETTKTAGNQVYPAVRRCPQCAVARDIAVQAALNRNRRRSA